MAWKLQALAKNASNAEGNENVQTQHGAHTSTPSLLVVDEIINTVAYGSECVRSSRQS